MADVLSIGPGDFLASGPFILSKPEFVLVQTYVEAGKRLPTTSDAFVTEVGVRKEDVGQFQGLIGAYGQIAGHCTYFSTTTFPMSVNLASDVVHYNTKVPIYYGALNPIIQAWNDGTMSPEDAQKKLSAILDNLKTAAQSYADDAGKVKADMIKFVEDSKSDQTALEANSADIRAKYAGDQVTQNYMDQIANAQRQIQYWNDQYSYDVTVAATTPTYAWVFPFGTIAAAVVAGVYGKRATDALDEVHKYNDILAKAQGDLRIALNLNSDLHLADQSLQGILDKVKQALPVLEKIEGIWGAIADDLQNVLTAIARDIQQAPAIIKDLGVAEAIQQWAQVAAIADTYRANAYITVKPESEIKNHPQLYAVPRIVA